MQNETQVTSTAWMGDAYLSTREPESWSDSTTLAIAPPEAAEKASREQFGIAFRDSAVAMGVMDVGGRFLRVNRALCGLMARSENELLAGSWQAMVHPEDVEEPLAYRRNALAGGADSYRGQVRHTRADGEVIRGLVSLSLIKDPEGRALFFFAQIFDVTEQMGAQEQLRVRTSWIKLLQKVAVQINGAATFEEAMQAALVEICTDTQWPVGHVYKVQSRD